MSDTIENTTPSAISNTQSSQHPSKPPYAPRLLTQLTSYDHKPVGKVVTIDPVTGGISTSASVAVPLWKAQTLCIDSLRDMADLIDRQGSDQALILDHVEGTAVGESFWLGSEKLLSEGWQSGDGLKVVQLTKRFFKPSGWVCLDWDYDPGRPEELRDADVKAWWERVCRVVPQLQGAGRVVVPSSKGRVLGLDGEPAFRNPSYHIYIQTENRGLVENVGKLIEARFWLAGEGYKRVGKGGAALRRTPFDPCTWSVSRRVFESAPVVMNGLGLMDRQVEVFEGPAVDLQRIPVLSKSEVDRYKELTHREISYSGEGSGGQMRVHCTSAELSLDTLVETKEYGELSVRQYMEQGLEKERCQTPFRESDSWAAYLNRHERGVGLPEGELGEPFLYDVGTGTKYVLNAAETAIETHGDAIAAGIAGSVGGGAGVEKIDFSVPVGEVGHFERLRDSISSIDVHRPAEVRRFIDDVLTHLNGLELDQVTKLFSVRAKPAYSADGVKQAFKDARAALGERAREARVAQEREQLAISRQMQAIVESKEDGFISNPWVHLSIDAVGYPEVILDAEGKVETVFPVTQNLRQLCTALDITIQRNLMTHSTEIILPGYTFSSDDPKNHAYECLKDTAIASGLPSERLKGMVGVIANERQYHPMLDWIERLPSWDRQTDYIGQLSAMVGVEKGKEGSRDLFIRRWLVSGMAFLKGWVGKDGVPRQPKGVLTLAGSQHIGKTAFLAKLVPNPDWFLEGHLLQPGDKDSEKLYASHFLVELGEVDSTFRKSDIAALKAFLSKGRDDMRLPYDKEHVTWQRRTLPCATVNKLDFLTDETGNSRFWPIECLSFDFPALNAFYAAGGVQGLWKQVEALYEAGERWWLDENGEKAQLARLSEEHRQVGAVEQLMLDHWDFSGWEAGVHSSDKVPDNWRILKASEIAIEIGYGAAGPGGRFGIANAVRQVLKDFTGQTKGKSFRCRNDSTGISAIVKGWRVPPLAEKSQFLREI